MTITAIIVQARMTSTRLPRKVLLPLAGQTVLWHVLTRCAAIASADVVCCAIPDGAANAPIVDEAARAGAIVSRGSETDVLARYADAASAVGADIIMRVTSDCPVIDPRICDTVLHARATAAAGYACNNLPRRWPHGLDCEAFTRAALDRANATATAPQDREHVTPWLRRDPSVSRVHVAGPDAALANHRWTLDRPDDYRFFEALFAHLPSPPHIASTDEILTVVTRHPEISALNTSHSPQVPA